MFKKPSSGKPAGKPLLTKSERRKVEKIIKTAKRDDGIPRTAQQTIPFERMFADGTCRVRDGYYTRTIQFQDINCQLALQEDKTAIFEEWCSFLNFFDSSVHFEFSFVNMAADKNAFLPARWGKEKTQITSAPSQQNIGAAPAFIPQPRKNIDALRPEPKGREPFF